MKKLVTAFAACMLAGFVSAQVTSQNVVGYSSATVDGWSMHSVAFDPVGGGGFVANNNIQGAFTAGDTLQIWNGSDYSPVVFGDIYDETVTTVIGQGWLDPDTGYTAWTGTVARGVGFWINTQVSTPVTFVGQVPPTGSFVVELVQGWNLVGNGSPTDVVLNNAVWTGVAAGDVVDGWNGLDYVPVVYGDIYDETVTTVIGQGWLDPNTGYTAMTDPLSGSASGFWVSLAAATGTVTFTLTY